jgi:hypothetical protein
MGYQHLVCMPWNVCPPGTATNCGCGGGPQRRWSSTITILTRRSLFTCGQQEALAHGVKYMLYTFSDPACNPALFCPMMMHLTPCCWHGSMPDMKFLESSQQSLGYAFDDGGFKYCAGDVVERRILGIDVFGRFNCGGHRWLP